MSKRLIMLMVLAFVVGITASAFAEVQNVKVGGDLSANYLNRQNLFFTKDSADADSTFASHTRVKIDANLTDNVDVCFRLLNERTWGSADSETTTPGQPTAIDLDLAYMSFKDFMKDTIGVPLTLVAGRQNIKIGSGLLIGSAGTNQSNTTQLPIGAGDLSYRGAFDAIVGVWQWLPEFTVITGYVNAAESSVIEGNDLNVYVVDGAFAFGEDYKNLVLGGTYALSHQDKADTGVAGQDINNFGIRASAGLIENLNVEGEYVYQTLRKDSANAYIDQNNKNKSADAWRLAASFGMPDVVWAPTVAADVASLSSKWNVMHESWVPADLANLIFQNTNMRVIGATVSAKPMDAMMLKLRYANFKARQAVGATYTSVGTTNTYTTVAGKKELGSEVDLAMLYDYTEDVQFALCYGKLMPGKAFAESNRKSASQVLGSMKVTF
jgi:hypothetical protein